MNKMINLLYVDDNLDITLSKYLSDYKDVEYDELKFDCSILTYEDLMRNENIRNSNVIVIDSCLFENDKVCGKKFTGEEFKILLKKSFPYIKVIVISQNDENKDLRILSKYKGNGDVSPNTYYDEELAVKIESARADVIAYNLLAEKVGQNNNIDKALSENIINSINGIDEYDQLKSSDVDALINQFKELKEYIVNEK